MGLKISDMMDHVENIQIEIGEKNVASVERIKEKTMKKVHDAKVNLPTAGKFSRVGVIAAVMAAILCVTAAAAAVVKWGGFALTGSMSAAEIEALLNEAETAVSSAYVEEDGTVHYLDADNKEILVLSADEAKAYEQKRQEEHDLSVAESTSLVDACTIPFMPNLITEMAVNNDGEFSDFALGNASMILLHPAGKDGFDLMAGDVVTIKLTANDSCILEFGEFKDGDFVRAEAVTARQHSCTFEIEEAGTYCFSVKYCSSDASSFTNCMITVE